MFPRRFQYQEYSIELLEIILFDLQGSYLRIMNRRMEKWLWLSAIQNEVQYVSKTNQ